MVWDTISQTTDKVTRSDTTPGPMIQEVKLTVETEKNQKKTEAEEDEEKKKTEVSEKFLDDLEQDIELIHNIGLKFSIHNSTGRTMVKVINKESGEMIREIPSKKFLDLAAKLEEMIGIIFDKKI